MYLFCLTIITKAKIYLFSEKRKGICDIKVVDCPAVDKTAITSWEQVIEIEKYILIEHLFFYHSAHWAWRGRALPPPLFVFAFAPTWPNKLNS